MLQQTIPLSWAARHAKGALASGLSLEYLLERSLISPTFGDRRDHITVLQLTLFYASLVHETSDGTHAMLSRRFPIGTNAIAFRILFGSVNLGDGIEAMGEFYRMCSSAVRINLSTEGRHAVLALQIDEDRPEARLQEDIQLSYLYLGLSSFLDRPFPCSRVTTRDAGHVNLGGTHWAIRKPLSLHSAAGLVFPKALLAERPRQARVSDLVWRPFDTWISFVEESVFPPQSGVSNKELQIARLASEAGVASSTYRRLSARQTGGFRRQREEALLDATLTLLRERSGTLDDIAAELGYSDERSLRRFVKRATGRTPAELRLEIEHEVSPAMVRARLKETVQQILG